jgi:hypothetical protein
MKQTKKVPENWKQMTPKQKVKWLDENIEDE